MATGTTTFSQKRGSFQPHNFVKSNAILPRKQNQRQRSLAAGDFDSQL